MLNPAETQILHKTLLIILALIWNNLLDITKAIKKLKLLLITLTRRVRHTDNFIGDQKLDYVEMKRLIGVPLKRSLGLCAQKSVNFLGFAQRSLKGCTPKVKRTAHLTMVKPILLCDTPA